MDKRSYPLKLSEDMSVNLFKHSTIKLCGSEKVKFVRTLIERNSEYDSIVLDRDNLIENIECTEFFEGDKAIKRLEELAEKEVDRRMAMLAEAACRNFFEYNKKNTEGEEMRPTLVFYVSTNLGHSADKLLRSLAVFAKAVGLFVFFLEPQNLKVSYDLLASSFFDITIDSEDGTYTTEYFAPVCRDFKL